MAKIRQICFNNSPSPFYYSCLGGANSPGPLARAVQRSYATDSYFIIMGYFYGEMILIDVPACVKVYVLSRYFHQVKHFLEILTIYAFPHLCLVFIERHLAITVFSYNLLAVCVDGSHLR